MKKLWTILKSPSRLDEYAEADSRFLKPWWKNTRVQIHILHALCVTYVLIVCTSVNYFGATLGLPAIHGKNGKYLYLAQILLTYFCVSGIVNYLFILYFSKKSHFGFGRSKELPFSEINGMREPDWSSDETNSAETAIPHSEWKKCIHCGINVPPRARHCSICQTCVLKKDHHCFFTGCCIGFYNQQFFVKYAFFGVVGGLWGLISLVAYLHIYYAPVFSLEIYKYFLPYCVLSTILGATSLSEAVLIMLVYLNLMCVVTAIYFFSCQMLVIIQGQTSYELVKRIKKNVYTNDIWSNFRSVFGPNWIVGFLIPLPLLSNEGNVTLQKKRLLNMLDCFKAFIEWASDMALHGISEESGDTGQDGGYGESSNQESRHTCENDGDRELVTQESGDTGEDGGDGESSNQESCKGGGQRELVTQESRDTGQDGESSSQESRHTCEEGCDRELVTQESRDTGQDGESSSQESRHTCEEGGDRELVTQESRDPGQDGELSSQESRHTCEEGGDRELVTKESRDTGQDACVER